MDARARHTWGRHSFANAAITGAMIGVSGTADPGNVAAAQPARSALPVPPSRQAGVGVNTVHYGVPDQPSGSGPSEIRLAEIANQAGRGHSVEATRPVHQQAPENR